MFKKFFELLFKKKIVYLQQTPVVDLSRWRKLLADPDGSINSVVKNNHIEDIAVAIVHTDEKTRQRFIESAKLLNIYNELKKAMKNNQNISKYKSDEAKILLITTYNAKGFTPLPGFQPL